MKLPAIGRPSVSGLSVKALGVNEYNRRLTELRRRQQGIPPRNFTGLSLKVLGMAEYTRQFRALKKGKKP